MSPSTIYFPNAFSPNEDGGNEIIFTKSLFFYNNTKILGRNFSIEIFNCSGEKIFQSITINDERYGIYKGKQIHRGVYMNHLKAMGANYRSFSISGIITILQQPNFLQC
jgi:hypothetical protein